MLQYIINSRSQLMLLKYNNFIKAQLAMKRQEENDNYFGDIWSEADRGFSIISNDYHFYPKEIKKSNIEALLNDKHFLHSLMS